VSIWERSGNMPIFNSDLALEVRRKTVKTWVQAGLLLAIVGLWLFPMALFLHAVFNDGVPFSMVGCALFMSVALVALILPDRYYQARSFERSGRLYEWLGVRWYKRFMLEGDFVMQRIRRFIPDYKVIAGRRDLEGFALRTRKSEQGHLLWMLVAVPALVYALLRDWWLIALWLFLGNLVINVYPIMLQRYNRARIQQILVRIVRTESGDRRRTLA
jgi:hypothetical protein